MNANDVPKPLQVSDDGHYFLDGEGKPFFWLSDTAWPLFSEHKREDAETYLKRRAEQGFNVIKGTLAWPGGTGLETPNLFPNYAGYRPWQETPAQPDERYFEHVDYLVAVAAENGLILNMLPTWGYYVRDLNVFNTENAREYGLWLGQRYRNKANVIWTVGGDRVPLGFEDVYRAMAYGLREGDDSAHLISYHTTSWTSSSYYFHREDWLDFNMIQTWTQWDRIYPTVLADRLLSPPKPVVMDEGAYEDGPEYPFGPVTPLLARKQAWWTFMAGGFHTYGHNDIWRAGEGWLKAVESPGAQQMTQFRAIAEMRPWWRMAPDQSLFATGVSSEKTLNAALRLNDSRCAMVYLSSQCDVRLNMHMIMSDQVRATWVDPRNGEQNDAGVYPSGYRQEGHYREHNVWFSTPDFWEDAVLILDAVDG